MARPRADVTDAELAVLEVLWSKGPSTIRRLTDILYKDSSPTHYSTVQKLLERLEGKDCVKRRRESGAHVFEAAIEKQELIGLRLEDVAEKLCGGSLTPLLSHLVQSAHFSKADRRELHDLIRLLDDKNRQSSKKGES